MPEKRHEDAVAIVMIGEDADRYTGPERGHELARAKFRRDLAGHLAAHRKQPTFVDPLSRRFQKPVDVRVGDHPVERCRPVASALGVQEADLPVPRVKRGNKVEAAPRRVFVELAHVGAVEAMGFGQKPVEVRSLGDDAADVFPHGERNGFALVLRHVGKGALQVGKRTTMAAGAGANEACDGGENGGRVIQWKEANCTVEETKRRIFRDVGYAASERPGTPCLAEIRKDPHIRDPIASASMRQAAHLFILAFGVVVLHAGMVLSTRAARHAGPRQKRHLHMRIAVGIVDMFANGGLQRDCLAICTLLRDRGHDLALYCARAEKSLVVADGIQVLPTQAWTNHGRDAAFGRAFHDASRGVDIRLGFNKLPGLDVLYCADPCVEAGSRSVWKSLLPRHRTRRDLEAACFSAESKTVALLLSEPAIEAYRTAWSTPSDRLKLLPPTIAAGRIRPDLRDAPTRNSLRTSLGIKPSDVVWLFVGAQPHTKGLDRVVDAMTGDPQAHLYIAGLESDHKKAKAIVGRASRRGLSSRVRWLGHREDVAEIMAAADVLVHPARYDTTGQVILEALAVGLPVVTTAACGFSIHVAHAGAGTVVPEPFAADVFRSALAAAADRGTRDAWSRSALAYAAKCDFTHGHELAADLIVAAGRPGRDRARSGHRSGA